MGNAAWADDDDSAQVSTNAFAPGSRFGLLDGLDHGSAYNRDFFPQPLLVDDTSLEDGELEFGYLHTQAHQQHDEVATAGAQESFGMFTCEIDVPYERAADADDSAQSVGNIQLEARYPLYEYVSGARFFDTTLGVAMEAGIPIYTKLSKNAELDPEVFNDLKLGDHVSVQTILGYDATFGGGEGGGLQSFEYNFAFGYRLPHNELPLPGVERLTPLFELVGETGLNKDEAGQNSLLGSMGFRLDFKRIAEVHPSVGVGYLFPLDSGERQEVHWGIVTSLVLEF